MRQARFLLFLILAVSFAFSLDFSLKTNVDAEVTFKNGGNSQTETTVGGQTKNVSIPWINSQMDVEISAKPQSENSRYKDTTFTQKMGSNASSGYPAWDKGKQYNKGDKVSYNGKDWECGWWSQGDTPGGASPSPWTAIAGESTPPITINLSQKPLPTDTAFIPVYSNRDAKIEISSSVANGSVSLKGRKTGCVLALPLESGGRAIDDNCLVCDGIPVGNDNGNNSNAIGGKSGDAKVSRNAGGAKLISQQGRHLLSLSPKDYKNGEIRVVSINGRVISTDKLSGINQTSITISNVAAGVYLLNVKGSNNAAFTAKIFHNGGDLRVAASFNSQFEVGGLVNSRIVRTAETRAGSVSYRLLAKSQGLQDITININAVGGMNARTDIRFNDPNALPSENFEELLSREMYEQIFPNRFGFGRAVCANMDANADQNCSKGKEMSGRDGDYDFYSYDALLKAIDLLGEVEIELRHFTDNAGNALTDFYQIDWKNKKTGVTRTIGTPSPGYGSIKSFGKIDYADFCNKGDLSQRKQELAAFLANITQETSGWGGYVPPRIDKWFHWGLYYQQEIGYNSESKGYQTPDPAGYHVPNPAKSYHGRGPKQLTHPYNYGRFSEFLYGDRFVLLNDPDKLVPVNRDDGTVAIASAIWFWMTPQPPKPSCHQIFRSDFTPSSDDVSKGRTRSKIGWTVSIINGGLEGCGGTGTINDGLGRVPNRVWHYKHYIELLGESPQGDLNLGCDRMGY